jgi:hypothetical protein
MVSESSRMVVETQTQLPSSLKLKVSKSGSDTPWAAAGRALITRANDASGAARRMTNLLGTSTVVDTVTRALS